MSKGTTDKGTIDRFEDALAVLEVDGAERTCPRAALPKEAREGDVIDLATMTVDAEATRRLREETEAALARLQGKTQPPGSFDL
jgi:hypothetical protein